MFRSSCLRYHAVIVVVCCLVQIACCLSPVVAAETARPDAESMMPDPDAIIRKILGVDDMAKNVCLISSHQMVNAADLPGRLVAISADRQVPADLLRYSFRKPGAKTTTQVNPPTAPIQVTRLESSQAKSGSFLSWFGASMAKEDIAELRTIPLPATSVSVDNLDEQAITERFSTVPAEVRKGLGIITDVIPYEIWASICKKTTNKTEAGIWYIKLGRDIYSRQSDELRKYYLVAVYTPLVFYDDIGIISSTKSTEPWLPDKPVRNRAEALSLWLKDQTGFAGSKKFAIERQLGWMEAPEPDRQTDPGNITPQQDPPAKTGGGLTTVMPQ